jgi:hypothetical protein
MTIRHIAAVLTSLLLSGSLVVAQGIGGGGGITGAPATDPVTLTVCPSGCQFSKWCGISLADCDNGQFIDCDADSVLTAAKALSPDPNQPVLILGAPGLYQECVAVRDMTDVTLDGRGATIHLRPSATDNTAPVGTMRIGDEDDSGCISSGVPWSCCTGSGTGSCESTRTTQRIKVTGFRIRNDCFSSPCPALAIGGINQNDTGSGGISSATDILITGNVIIGHHDAIQTFGDVKALPDEGWMRVELSNNIIISGADPEATKGTMQYTSRNNRIINDQAYCGDPNLQPAVTAVAPDGAADEDALCTGAGVPYACCSGAGDGTCENIAFVLDPNHAQAATNYYSMRTLAWTDTDPNVPCVVSGSARRGIATYDPNNNIVFFDASLAEFLTPPDATCTYEIAAINRQTYAGTPACDTEPFWMRMPASASWDGTHQRYATGHKRTAYHNGNPPGGGCPQDPNNAGSFVHISDMDATMLITSGSREGIWGVRDRNACVEELRVSGSIDALVLEPDRNEFLTSLRGVAGCFSASTANSARTFLDLNCRFENAGNVDLNVDAFSNAKGTTAEAISWALGFIDASATVDGYAGSVSHLYTASGKAGDASLEIGNLVWGQSFTFDPNAAVPSANLMPGGSLPCSVTTDPNSQASACEDLTTCTVPGAAVGDVCAISARTATAGAIYDCRVSAADTVTPRFCAIGTVNPGSTVFDILVTGR